MRAMRLAIPAVVAALLASTAHAGLILSVVEIDSGDPNDELLVFLQITGTEGVSSIQYDLVFDGVGVSATNLAVGPIPASSPNCPEEDIDPPGPPTAGECVLDPHGQPSVDGTNFALATIGLGPTGGTYSIGYQTIQAGTWDGTAGFANVVAFNNAGNAILDIQLGNIPEPAAATLIGLGLGMLAAMRRRVR